MTSRPPSLSTIVRRALDTPEACALPVGSTIVVAVSGGPDSMALLDVLARLGPHAGLEVRAHGVDHGLRAEAAAELALAGRFAERLGVPWSTSRVSVPPGGNVQARAREARWSSLVDVARAAVAGKASTALVAIATGHHADDRAETLLIRLLRGAGARGLGVLPPRATAPGAGDVTVVRPILRARRDDVLMHIERHVVPFATDPSNDDRRYLRTRVRREVLPLLEQLDPTIVRHLEDLADELGVSAPGSEARRPEVDADATGEPEWARALPRATRRALRELRDGGQVWLPGGFVLTRGVGDRGCRAPRHPRARSFGRST